MLKEKQIQLFDVVSYGGKKQRGHYNKQPKKYIKELNPHLKLIRTREEIANFLPIPLMAEVFESKDYGKIRLWCQVYNSDEYEYNGEFFEGENFKIIEAELIGTEKLSVSKSLYWHKKLLNMAKNGWNIQEAAEQLQDEINESYAKK